MTDEERQRVEDCVRFLDQAVPLAPASLKLVDVSEITEEDNEAVFYDIVGTREGYLRLGVELLKASTAAVPEEWKEGSFLLDADLSSFWTEASESSLKSLLLVREMVEAYPSPPPPTTFWSQFTGLFIAGGCSIVLIVFIIGIGTIIRWIFG